MRNLRSFKSSADFVDDERAELSVVLASFIAVMSDNFLHDSVDEQTVELPVEVEVEVAVMALCPVTRDGVN